LSGTAFYLNNTSYWIISGFQLTNSLKAILLDNSDHVLINDVYTHEIGQEAVHFRSNSCDNTIQNSTISYTGRTGPGYGEGIYIGSAVENWVNGIADLSNRNKVLNNHFGPNIGAEAIDIKEATEGHLIDGNYFDGTGMSGVNSAGIILKMEEEIKKKQTEFRFADCQEEIKF